jgi:uncharacterized membrane protein
MQGDFSSRIHPELTTAERVGLGLAGGFLTLYGLRRHNMFGLGVVAVGAAMLYRTWTGNSAIGALFGRTAREQMAPPWRRPVRAEKSIYIAVPCEEVYAFWRNFENLPRFVKHLVAVKMCDLTTSRWIAKGPAGRQIEWEAEVVSEEICEHISWESLPGSDVPNKGTVRFCSASDDKGTMVHVSLEYLPPAGVFGAALARFYGEEPQIQLEEDLGRLKAVLERTEVPAPEHPLVMAAEGG